MNKLNSTLAFYKNIQESLVNSFNRDPDALLSRWMTEMRNRFATPMDAMKQWQHEMHGYNVLINQLSKAKTILFSTDQVEVFRNVSQNYTESLDYRLPFPFMFIQLSSPLIVDVPMEWGTEPSEILYFVLSQHDVDESQLLEWRKMADDPFNVAGFAENLNTGIANNLYTIYSDMNVTRFGWMSEDHNEFIVNYNDGKVSEFYKQIKRICIACVGYINCENIYLEKQGEVDEAINRKREAKGKSRLEPYYVCRIKGVQHDSHATGEGSKHGIRYDVRGHFRRLDTGKTIWVRPHQRGLQNELYIPKVYKVEKGSKPQWKA